MKESERLTKSGEDWFWKDEEAWVIAEEVSAEQIDEVYYKLAAYEDTGLSPEEVEKLKAENAELRTKVEGTPELEFQIGDTAYYIEFAFCDGYDEKDEMTHDVEFYVCQKRLDTECERLHACGDYLEQKAFKSKKAAKEAAEARLKEMEAGGERCGREEN